MRFSANFKVENFKYFIECLNCLNKLSRDVSRNSYNLLVITKEKINIITKTNGLLDSFYEINNTELFLEQVVLSEEILTIEININSLYDSLFSSVKSENILIYISNNDDENLYLKYVDSFYNTINLTLKIPILIVENDYNRLPEIPFTNYNINLSKLQTLSYLLSSLKKTGNTVVELNISKEEAPEITELNRCTLKFKSIGNIVNIESVFNNLQIFSSYPAGSQPGFSLTISSIPDQDQLNIHLSVNILNLLFKSIIESNLYNKNKSLVIVSVPDDLNNNQFIYVIISIIQLESCQMIFIVPNIKD